MNKLLFFALPVMAIGLLFSCSSDIESAEDILGKGDSSSSYLPGALVFCSNSAGCAEISAEACISFGGTIVASCSASSSSSLAGVSSSSSPFVVLSSSSIPISSSSLPGGFVFCMSAVGCAEMSAEACSAFGGTNVASCPAGSSSSFTAVSSSSSPFSVLSSSSSFGSPVVGANEPVTVGTQVWMKRNLDVEVQGSKCYDNDPENCTKYGRLYDWATAMKLTSDCNSNYCSSQINSPHQGICPSGWHIPSDGDWDILMNYVGGSSVAGKKLKTTWDWYNDGNGTDEYGFSALPGGYGDSDDRFSIVGHYGYWWSASEDGLGGTIAYSRGMNYYVEDARWSISDKSYLSSVRCLQD